MGSRVPPQLYFVVSALFHALGPAFAVLLFARVDVLGVAWLRIASAAAVFALWRRPWRALARLDRRGRGLLLRWGAILALMNVCFYSALDRLPLGTVAAIEFLPVILLAAAGARTLRNFGALALGVPGVYLLTDVRIEGEPLGVAFAFANAVCFALYIVHAHRAARYSEMSGIDGLRAGPDRPAGSARGARSRYLVVGDPVRHRPARDAQAAARHLRADDLAAAGGRDGDRSGGVGPGAVSGRGRRGQPGGRRRGASSRAAGTAGSGASRGSRRGSPSRRRRRA